MDQLSATPLYRWLKSKNPDFANKVQVVRNELSTWLPRIIQLFPHYPSHGLDHSDRIVAQLSRILFDSRGKLKLKDLSQAEAYCLLCAVYIHDMGMVASRKELEGTLSSSEWKGFIGEGGQGERDYRLYREQRDNAEKVGNDLDIFCADAAFHLILAEYIRYIHADRCKTTLSLHPFLRRLIDSGDPMVFETIGNIGVSHGLSDVDLLDEIRFPEHRNILGGEVNVRFLARLMRIGDLLDIDPRRADAMVAIAAAPLPPESIAHWSQYEGKVQESITPSKIEFRFLCKDQKTHRILRDWFGWLELEVQNTLVQQAHSKRHQGWTPPRCIVSSKEGSSHRGPMDPTIWILPAEGANYTFHDWKLELDKDQVLDRLINDIYETPEAFVRELTQNALDATRCQMFADHLLQHPDEQAPQKTTQFSASYRETYPVLLSLEQEFCKSETPRWVFTIEDFGIGMDEQILQLYFLQVGRSYYRSPEFRQHYAFAPTSRFGIGFLSVFAVSDDVTVETSHCPEGGANPIGIRLNLRGPSSYILTERWQPFQERPPQRRTGTRITIILRNNLSKSLFDIVKNWCLCVEVPIRIIQNGSENTLHAFHLQDREIELPSKVDPEGRFRVRVFDLDTLQAEGQLALLAYEDEQGEGWCDCWSKDHDLSGERLDKGPKLMDSFECLHGICLRSGNISYINGYENRSSWRTYLDFRSETTQLDLRRNSLKNRRNIPESVNKALHTLAQEAIEEHFRTSQRCNGAMGYFYKGRVLSQAPVEEGWRSAISNTVLGWKNGERVFLSVDQLLAIDELVLLFWPKHYLFEDPVPATHPRCNSSRILSVSPADVPAFAKEAFANRVASLVLISVDYTGNLWSLRFKKQQKEVIQNAIQSLMEFRWFSTFPSKIFALRIESIQLREKNGTSRDLSVINKSTPTARWLVKVLKHCEADHDLIGLPVLTNLFKEAFGGFHLGKLLDQWRSNPKIPKSMRPPASFNSEFGVHMALLEARLTGNLPEQ